MAPTVITGMVVKDIRFPTSLEKHGSDAMVSSVYDTWAGAGQNQ